MLLAESMEPIPSSVSAEKRGEAGVNRLVAMEA